VLLPIMTRPKRGVSETDDAVNPIHTRTLIPVHTLPCPCTHRHHPRRLKPNADALRRIMGTVHGHNQRVMESVGRVQDFKTGDGSVEEHSKEAEGGGGEGDTECFAEIAYRRILQARLPRREPASWGACIRRSGNADRIPLSPLPFHDFLRQVVFNAAVEILRLARCYQVGITFQDPSLAEAAARALDREGGKEGREEPREGTTVPRDHPSSSGLAGQVGTETSLSSLEGEGVGASGVTPGLRKRRRGGRGTLFGKAFAALVRVSGKEGGEEGTKIGGKNGPRAGGQSPPGGTGIEASKGRALAVKMVDKERVAVAKYNHDAGEPEAVATRGPVTVISTVTKGRKRQRVATVPVLGERGSGGGGGNGVREACGVGASGGAGVRRRLSGGKGRKAEGAARGFQAAISGILSAGGGGTKGK